MSDRLHEIIAQVATIHKNLQINGNIKDANIVLTEISTFALDIQNHYKNLLLQFYFQENDLTNFKILLLQNAKFNMSFEDVKSAFVKISSNKDNVIEFMADSIVYLKDNNLKDSLDSIYSFYKKDEENQVNLEESIEIIKRNRYVCAYCYKNKIYEEFFINEDLLKSIKRDLSYILK